MSLFLFSQYCLAIEYSLPSNCRSLTLGPFSGIFYVNAHWCQKIKPTQTNCFLLSRSLQPLPCLNRPCSSSCTIPTEEGPFPHDLTAPAQPRRDEVGEGLPDSSLSSHPLLPPSGSPQAGISRRWRRRQKSCTERSKRSELSQIVSSADYQRCLL